MTALSTSAKLFYFPAAVLSAILLLSAMAYSESLLLGLLFLPVLIYLLLKPGHFLYILLLVRPSLELWTTLAFAGPYIPLSALNINTAISVIVWLVFCVSVLGPVVFGRAKIHSSIFLPIVKAWLAFLGFFLVVSLLVSPDRSASLLDWGRWMSMFAVFLIALLYGPRSVDGFALLLFCLVLSSVPPVIGGFVEYAQGGGSIAFSVFRRIGGFFINPVAFSQFLAIVGVALFTLIRYTRSQVHRALLGLYSGILMTSLALSYGKGAWIGLTVGLIIMGLRERMYIRRLFWFSIPIAVGIAFLTLVPDIVPWILTVFNLTDVTKSSLATRIFIWNEIVPLFLSSPIIGHGLHAGYSYSPMLLGFLMGPHSDYLRLLVDGGIIGTFLFFMLIWTVFRALTQVGTAIGQRDPRVSMLINCAISLELAFLVMASVDNILSSLVLQYALWIMIGSLVGLHQDAQLPSASTGSPGNSGENKGLLQSHPI